MKKTCSKLTTCKSRPLQLSGGGGAQTERVSVKVERKSWEKLLKNDYIKSGDPGMTSGELAKEYSISVNIILRRLRKLIEDGKVVVGVGLRENSIGVLKPVPVYSIEIKK